MLFHHFKELKRTVDIVVIIVQRFGNRFTHRFESGEMDHALDRVGLKNPIQILPGADVPLDNRNQLLCDLLDPADALRTGVGKIIEYNRFETVFDQLYQCVRADVASSTRNQYHLHSPLYCILSPHQ